MLFCFSSLLNDTLNIIVDNNWENDGKTEKVIEDARAKPEGYIITSSVYKNICVNDRIRGSKSENNLGS